jgi:DnaJ-class molecular chaperone
MNIDMLFNPEKYGMAECSHCNGYGSSLKENSPCCSVCGGSGLVKIKKIKSDEKVKS